MRKKRNLLYVLLALFMFILSASTAYGQETEGGDSDKTLSPYFFVEGGDSETDSFPLKDTKVTANINGVIAETYVTQTYTNEGTTPINASYVFPASTRVSVHGMKMEIGDKVITAKIKEREEAKAEFEEAKSEGKSASLLEQQRPNVFNMNVANIMPGDVVKIELHYSELIVSTEGTYQFVFPTVVGPRYVSPSEDQDAETNQWTETPYLKEGKTPAGAYDISVNLSAGVPISDLTCSSHKIKVTKDNDSTAKVTLSNPEDYAGNRDFILDYKLTGEEVSCGLMLNKGGEENFFLMMVQPPQRFKSEDIPPRDYVFVLDVSGSMYGFPLDTAKILIKNLVSNLRETDTFNVILFSGAAMQMSPRPVPATADNIQKAIKLIDEQDGGGGTELTSALRDAVAIPRDRDISRSVVVITDGYISDEKATFDLIRRNLDTTSFFSFGIGSSVSRYLIDGIAKAGQGEAFVVTDPNEADKTAERFRTYIQAPILTDIQVTYDGFDAYDTEPSKLPTLFAERPIILFGRWRGEPGGTIKITGKTGSQDYVKEISVADVTPLETNNALPYLWARTKVENLTDYGSSNSDEEAVKKEVTALGLKYSMMTPYTSFIAVTDIVRNKDGQGKDVKQPLPLPEGVSDLAIGGYTSGSEPGEIILAGGIIFLVLLNLFCRGIRRVHRRKVLSSCEAETAGSSGEE